MVWQAEDEDLGDPDAEAAADDDDDPVLPALPPVPELDEEVCLQTMSTFLKEKSGK